MAEQSFGRPGSGDASKRESVHARGRPILLNSDATSQTATRNWWATVLQGLNRRGMDVPASNRPRLNARFRVELVLPAHPTGSQTATGVLAHHPASVRIRFSITSGPRPAAWKHRRKRNRRIQAILECVVGGQANLSRQTGQLQSENVAI